MPKKKAGKKGAKIIDGIATNEMTREQLMGHIKRMQMELDREREERNFFMLEREKLFSLWNLSLEQLTKEKDNSRLQELEMCEREKEKEAEMDTYKQKLRYLMTEQSRKLGEVRLHNLKSLKTVQDDVWKVVSSMRETTVAKSKELSKAQSSLYELMRNLRLQNAQSVSELRQEFGAELRHLEMEYDRKMHEQNEQRVSEQNEELEMLNISKSEHIEELRKLHEEQMAQVKGYFDEVTVNNFSVITALQKELEEQKAKEENLGGSLSKARNDFKQLQLELTKVEQEKNTMLDDDRKSAENIKKELSKVRRRLERSEHRAKILEAENEALIHKVVLAQNERDALKHTIAKAVLDMQKKSSMKRLILEMKLNSVSGKQLIGSGGPQQGTTKLMPPPIPYSTPSKNSLPIATTAKTHHVTQDITNTENDKNKTLQPHLQQPEGKCREEEESEHDETRDSPTIST